MQWRDRNNGRRRVVARLCAGMVLGLVAAGIYGGLVAAIYFLVTGNWDEPPDFVLGCVLTGALLGMLGGAAWALSGQGAAPVSRRDSPPPLPRQGIRRPRGSDRTPPTRGKRQRRWDR
jgi:hypothetical protein